jgi:hypothetical protein
MPTAPRILPTQIQEGVAPGLRYRLEGELVPVLHMVLDGLGGYQLLVDVAGVGAGRLGPPDIPGGG